jgi:sterol desaturase/sphingolipid hydroxylase (fatty acid hydroxylase superfamily)
MSAAESILDKIAGYVLAPFESRETLLASLNGIIDSFISLNSKTAWLYLLTSLVIASAVFYIGRSRGWVQAPSLWRFLFPREVFLHRSAIADYKYVAVDLTIKAIVYVPLFTGVSTLVYNASVGGFSMLADMGLKFESMPAPHILIPLISFLAADFGFFFSHYLMHKIPLLWHFHEVHHSAEVLTPITVYRVHPVEELINKGIGSTVFGAGAALYTVTTDVQFSLPTILGVNVLLFLFFAIAFQLRHSHVWLSYGPILSRIFISPAQHQIHHSREIKHWDRNFGFTFAFWDVLFRSLYVPKGYEALRLGVPKAHPEDFSTVGRIYWRPFVKAWRRLRGLEPYTALQDPKLARELAEAPLTPAAVLYRSEPASGQAEPALSARAIS